MPTSREILQKDKELVNTSKLTDIKNDMSRLSLGLDSNYVLEKAYKETDGFKKIDKFDSKTSVYQAMTLYEFDKGVLMCEAIPEKYRAFALEFSKNIQTELDCVTKQEKSLAEICTINYVRVLELENRITSYLRIGSITDTGVRYLDVMSKEMDRAQRHYLTSVQALRMLKLPPLEVNIKTQTAVIGQNQVIQTQNK